MLAFISHASPACLYDCEAIKLFEINKGQCDLQHIHHLYNFTHENSNRLHGSDFKIHTTVTTSKSLFFMIHVRLIDAKKSEKNMISYKRETKKKKNMRRDKKR